jgi:hypothetical protein
LLGVGGWDFPFARQIPVFGTQPKLDLTNNLKFLKIKKGG